MKGMYGTAMITMLGQSSPMVRGDTNIELVTGILLFMVAGFLMAFGALVAGRFVRSSLQHPEKGAPYECGEPAVGESWVSSTMG